MGDRYKPLCELGAGAFGKALVVRDTKTQIKHVSKVIQIKGLSSRALDRCVTEVAVLSACSHPNIVRYIEAFVSSGALHIVMEYASGGDLQQKIEKQNGVLFTSDMVLEWFLQVVLALEYIHSKNILHRDLKPQNIFLTDNGIVKLGDFGIARVLNSCDDLASTRIGTPFYISPEICEGKQYNSSSDMWAAGCLLYQMCTLRVPFHASNFDDLTKKIIKAEYEPIPSHFSEVIKLIVSKLLVATPDNRLSASKLLTLEPLHGMVLYLKNRNNRKGQASRSRSNSLVTARSRTQFHQKPRSASVNRLHKGNNENSETHCQVKGQNQTVKRPDTDKVETRCKNDRKNTTETAEKKSCCKHTVRSEQTDREDSQKHVKISDVKDTDGMQRNTEVQGCGVESLENKSHVGCVNETVGRNVLNDESKLKIDKKVQTSFLFLISLADAEMILHVS
ncbi:serine/threonine-protein kinase Nek1-like [Mercenaria mercenaria]|uniref:serine/threonine-protein kinase Nek1-like n=1 Tax=Mercenaria mercenaria TaxID=6596 RepID=UPI00234FA31E|nr:serine/threonine-protein kinase Nek1-like [Mercenaria mercenaria]